MRIFLILFCVFVLSSTGSSADVQKSIDYTCEDIKKFSQNTEDLDTDELAALGLDYERGLCVQNDYSRAFHIYSRVVKVNSSFVGVRLGYMYLNGLGVAPDLGRARYWFRSGAIAYFYRQDEISKFLLAVAFLGEPIPEIMREEIDRAAIESKGTPEVMMQNYRALLSGDGIHPVPERALAWLRLAMEKDHPGALYEFALQHRDEKGEDDNAPTYVLFLKRAAEYGHPLAQLELGKLYLAGKGVTLWPHKALVWFLRAKAEGIAATTEIQEAEKLLDPLGIELARKEAAKLVVKTKP